MFKALDRCTTYRLLLADSVLHTCRLHHDAQLHLSQGETGWKGPSRDQNHVENSQLGVTISATKVVIVAQRKLFV